MNKGGGSAFFGVAPFARKWREGERETERGSDRQRLRERDTERQRHRDRERHRQTDRQRDYIIRTSYSFRPLPYMYGCSTYFILHMNNFTNQLVRTCLN